MVLANSTVLSRVAGRAVSAHKLNSLDRNPGCDRGCQDGHRDESRFETVPHLIYSFMKNVADLNENEVTRH
jgi:hypothetical protein